MRTITMTASSRKPGLGFDDLHGYLNRYLHNKEGFNPKVEWVQSTLLLPEGRDDNEKVMVTLTAIITTDE